MRKLLTRVLGDPNTKAIKSLGPTVARVNELADEYARKSDDELRNMADEFRQDLAEGMTLDDILPDAFAAAREVASRTLKMRPYDVQIMGGTVLHQGKVAEMRTGEGKTLTAALAMFLNALEGKGAHLITVNDYLARRDTQWMGQLYHNLGLTIGCIQHDQAFKFDPEHEPDDERLRF